MRFEINSASAARSGAAPDALVPPRGGSLYRTLTLPPDASWIGKAGEAEVAAWFAAMGAPGASTYAPDAPHPYMQKTPTLDFCMIVEGEASLVLEAGETVMSTGEVAVVRGSNHAWANRSDAPCVIAVCMHAAS